MDYRQLQALAAVIDAGGFDKAAQRLYLTQSAISQRIRQLEEQLGEAVLLRGPPLQPTVLGQRLLRHQRQVALLRDELFAELSPELDRQPLKLAIGLNADSLATWFLDAVAAVLDEGALQLDLRVADQAETHKLLRDGEVLGCISDSDKAMQGCQCILLGAMRYRPLATPAFIRRYLPDGLCAEALLAAPAVEFNAVDALVRDYLRAFWCCEQPPQMCHRVPSPEGYQTLIERGQAWGMLPDLQSHAFVDSRGLQPLDATHWLDVPLYWHVWSLHAKRLDRLTEQLRAHAVLHLN